MAQKRVFIREATGLVREFSTFDSFAIGWNSTIIFALFFVQPAVTLFPGTNPMLALLLEGVFALFYGGNFSFLAMSMPRSGGDYVYDSRVVHPAAGFLAGLFMCFSQIPSGGFIYNLFWSWTMSWFLASLGLTQLSIAVTQPVWILVLGTITLIIVGILTVVPRKILSWFYRITIAASLVGAVIIVAILLSAIGRFPQIFETSTGVKYDSIIPLAIQQGFDPGFSLPATMMTLGWMGVGSLVVGGIFVSGETRDVTRSALWSSLYGSLTAVATFIGFMGITYLLTGYTWYNALTWLYNMGGAAYPISLGAQINNIAVLIAGSPAIQVVIAFTMLCSLAALLPIFYIIVTRVTFAWAFDRLAPERYADVSERFHTPIIPTVVSGIAFLIGLVITLWAGVYITYMAYGWLALFNVIIGALAGILFPYRKKHVFEQAPPLARTKLAGIPLVSIFGGGLLVFCLLFLGTALAFPTVNPINAQQGWIIVGATIVGLAWFYLARYYRLKTMGIDINLAFKEIPPE